MPTLVGVILIVLGVMYAGAVAAQIYRYGSIWLEARPTSHSAPVIVHVTILTMIASMLLGGLYLLTPHMSLCGRMLP